MLLVTSIMLSILLIMATHTVVSAPQGACHREFDCALPISRCFKLCQEYRYDCPSRERYTFLHSVLNITLHAPSLA